MRHLIWITALFLCSACTPVNVSDNRVMSDGKSNDAVVSGANANPQSGSTGKPASGDPNPALANFLPTAYNDELEPMMQDLCTNACHTGAPAPGPVLNTAETLKAAIVPATNRVTGGTMPPNLAALSAADKKLHAQLGVSLKNWAKGDVYALSLTDFTIAYTPAIAALSTALCISCHSGAQPAAGLRLETQDQWKTAMPRILTAVENGKMPPRVDEVQGPRLLKFLTTWQNQNFP